MAARPAGTAASRVRHEVRVRWLNALGSQAQPVQTGQLAPLFRDGAALCQLVQRLEPEAVLRYHRTVRSSKVAIGNIEQALERADVGRPREMSLLLPTVGPGARAVASTGLRRLAFIRPLLPDTP